MTPSSHQEGVLYWLAAIGALIGLGKLLASDEPVTFRKALGHSIVSAGLAASASLVLIPLPEVPEPVLYGAAALLASLGASTLSLILQKYIEKK